jgi:hypothetical protein
VIKSEIEHRFADNITRVVQQEDERMQLNKYLVELWHEPGISPLSNPTYRKMSQRTHEKMPALMEKYGIKMLGDYHLDPEHRAILIFEAKSVEDVRDLLYESGFMGWCDGRIFPTTPLSQLHKWATAQEIEG